MTLNKKELSNQLDILQNAINKLEEAIKEDNKSEIYRDAIIQRFEFTIELTWKTLKKISTYKWNQTRGFPKDFFKKFQEIWIIQNIDIRIDFLDQRNLLSHMYNEKTAENAYNFIIENHKEFSILHKQLKTYVEKN